MRVFGAITLCLFGVVTAYPQEGPHESREDIARPTVRMPLNPEAIPDNLESHVRAALSRIRHPQNRKEAEDIGASLRMNLKESLGYNLVPWPPDPRGTVTGTIQRDGYRIEKLVFQTLPKVIVTAHLYMPDGASGPVPAVLFWNGHLFREGKLQADSQTFCITMARLGFVVLNVDSMGVGERFADNNLHHPEALLAGLSEAGIDEYEARCALEYLASRKEVDANRIGMTGVDDAGFNTWITAALEERIAAAVPVDSTYDFADRIHRKRAADWDGAAQQSDLVPGILKYANIQELIALRAPRALMIIDGARVHDIYDYGAQLYGSFGDNGGIRLFESEGIGYDRPRRQAAYGFFLRALKGEGDGTPADEAPAAVSSPGSPELQCLPTGTQVSASQGISEIVRRLASSLPLAGAQDWLRALAGRAPSGAHFTSGVNTVPLTRINLLVEAGVLMPSTVLRPLDGQGGGFQGTLLAIADDQKDSLASDPVVQEALRRDYLVWEIDPRGFGEATVHQPAWQFAVSLLLGENFVWRQAWDIRGFADDLCNSGGTGHHGSLALYARGPNSSLAATYAIQMLSSSCLDWAVLRGGYTSVRQFLDYPPVMKEAVAGRSIPYNYFAFEAFWAPDLPQLLAPARARTFLVDPLDLQRARSAQSDRVRVATIEEFLAGNW